jgi:hypothetical protein
VQLIVMLGPTEPDNYDFEGTRAIAMLDGPEKHDSDSDAVPGEKREKSSSDFEEGLKPAEGVHEDYQIDHDTLLRVFKRAAWYSSAMSAIVILISELHTPSNYGGLMNEPFAVPLPMFFSHYVFSERFYTFWVSCSM